MRPSQFRPYQTKQEVTAWFKRDILPTIDTTDRPLVRQTWNNMVDQLAKNGDIRPGSNWTQPKFISRGDGTPKR